MTSVAVMGASGMLGSMVLDVLADDPSLDLIATVRSPEVAAAGERAMPDAEWREFDFADGDGSIDRAIAGADWVVNAIGLTKPYVRDDRPAEVERAVKGNAQFPFDLAAAADRSGARVIQIATDCVFSGLTGDYDEAAPHDALDVYGKTKSLGEVSAPNVFLLRCSIIGPETANYAFLLEWLRRQPRDATVNGYTDHRWNGVTTDTFGRLCLAMIREQPVGPGVQHVIPGDEVTKAQLLEVMADAFGRSDLTIRPGQSPKAINRTLRTRNAEANEALWTAAGYSTPPTIDEMVRQVAGRRPRLAELPR